MNHTGAEYTLTRSETPGFWQRQFRISDLVRSGKTEPMFLLLAQRRVQLRIANKARDGRLTSWSGCGFSCPSPLLPGVRPASDQFFYSCINYCLQF
jgi:hypothetical protein